MGHGDQYSYSSNTHATAPKTRPFKTGQPQSSPFTGGLDLLPYRSHHHQHNHHQQQPHHPHHRSHHHCHTHINNPSHQNTSNSSLSLRHRAITAPRFCCFHGKEGRKLAHFVASCRWTFTAPPPPLMKRRRRREEESFIGHYLSQRCAPICEKLKLIAWRVELIATVINVTPVAPIVIPFYWLAIIILT
ncbi:hypothetical protein PIB30_038005 [Stylosanthes scabra]|uniref:Uncharacterized protein n=1 Tax=Stylosanthes scabra TaxID=79078 RepID=A0ABU6RE45_9FABA|nr:hypothetical protein [Stylosanthes scabra]